MLQLKKLHVQEKEERQLKQLQGQQLHAEDEDELQPKAALKDEEVLAVLRDAPADQEDALHQDENAPAVPEEEDVKLPILHFF